MQRLRWIKARGDQPPWLIGERLFQDLTLQMVILKEVYTKRQPGLPEIACQRLSATSVVLDSAKPRIRWIFQTTGFLFFPLCFFFFLAVPLAIKWCSAKWTLPNCCSEPFRFRGCWIFLFCFLLQCPLPLRYIPRLVCLVWIYLIICEGGG